jgi:GNAT superfamily N-acetyltransferase
MQVVPEVRRATADDVDAISAVLARAFFDDPAVIYVFPAEGTRIRKLQRFFKLQIERTFLRRGEAYTTSDLKGAALWMPPQLVKPGAREFWETLPMVVLLGRRLIPTVRLMATMESHHPKERHYYLATVGTDPDWQGKGVGSALLQPVLDHCDEEGLPSYLESSKQQNLPFYHRHGFDITGQIHSPDGTVTLWMMWREPRGPR